MESKTDDQQPFLGFRNDPMKRDLADDDIDRFHHHQKFCKLCRRPRFLHDVVIFLGTSLLWIVAFYILNPGQKFNNSESPTDTPIEWSPERNFIAEYHNITSNAELLTCGYTLEEAKESGCVYDTLLNHWIPSQCYDRDFEVEYRDDNSWVAYADYNLTQPIALEDMGDHEFYYTSVRDHVNHCSMMWKKQFWTFFEERNVFDSIITDTHHTEHCAEYLKWVYEDGQKEPTRVTVGFAECWVRKTNTDL
ncbi:hypothetical protein CI238_07794 [Colletotrichum incanum]|uniref:Uncharacterized protein n=1 Tax=Colletotrichum incanum TaxID=1573173 RepID=A0A161W3M2_COLIC|nr:hypothetical protein CI238_07794 [Colletotrichum incanum]